MSALLAAGRLLGLAWSWRRPVIALLVGLLLLPMGLAGVMVQAQQARHVPAALVMPVKGATLTQGFGCTSFGIEPLSPACPGGHFHSGVDLAAALDTPIYAATGGTVVTRRDRDGYGLHLLIVRDPRFTTLYGHLDAVLVQLGDVVVAGQAIALMGSTGNSTGPHLHFEVRIAGVPVDPLPLLSPQGGGH
jgi:murein DD-endopeptidase MepM/ murein hydrolase activator NlpD